MERSRREKAAAKINGGSYNQRYITCHCNQSAQSADTAAAVVDALTDATVHSSCCYYPGHVMSGFFTRLL